MKNQALLPIAFLFVSISLTAQTTAIWQGGKPGRTTDWNCSTNWREGRIPDEFTQVIIPSGVDFYPIIKNEALPIDALLVEGTALLTIEEGGVLKVLEDTGRFDGITIIGKIMNNGTLEIGFAMKTNLACLDNIHGTGKVVRDSSNLANR